MARNIWLLKFMAMILLVPLTVDGQSSDCDSLQRSFVINTGYYTYGSIDVLHSPMLYAGESIYPGFRVIQENRDLKDEFTFRGILMNRPAKGFSTTMNGYDENNRLFHIKSLIIEANQAYFYRYKEFKLDHFGLFFAIHWNTWVNLVMNQSMKPEFLVSSLSPGMQLVYRNGLHEAAVSLNTNLLAYTCRDNYSNAVLQDYEKLSILTFIWKNSMIQSTRSFQTLFATIDYNIHFNERMALQAEYSFRYLSNQKPRSLKAVSGVYSAGVVLKLNGRRVR